MNFNEGLRLTNGCHTVLREYLKVKSNFFFGNKTLYDETETMIGWHFNIKCFSHDMERKTTRT